MSDNATPRNNSLNWALIISLCVNFLLVGVIVMAVVRFSMVRPLFAPDTRSGYGGRGMGHGVWQMQPLSPPAMMHVAPDKAGKIRAIMDAHRDRVHALRMASFEARYEALRLLEAKDFDQAAFDKALAKLQSSDAALETEVLKAVSQGVAILSPAERRAAADAAVSWRHHWRGHGRGHGHGHGRGHGRGYGRGWRHGGGPPPGDGP